MPAAPLTPRIRLLLAVLVVASTLGLLLSVVYATDAALSIIERLQRLPGWLAILTGALMAGVLALAGWLLWKLLRPVGRKAPPVRVAKVDRGGIEARASALGDAAAPIAAELAELDRRAGLDEVQVALFGDVSAGKSSLIRALVPGSDVAVDVRAGTTRSVSQHRGELPGGGRLLLADVPGTGEWQGEARAVAAREEALRAHVVAYVCDGDLTRSQAEEIDWLRGFGKPLLLVLNKADRYRAEELQALAARLRERTSLQALPVSAGGRESVLVRAADGSERSVERERKPELLPLLAALDEIAEFGPAEYAAARERAVLGALDLKLGAIEAQQRARQAAATVRDYARKAALGALAAVAPGSALVIQGVLATGLLRELCQLYQVPLQSIDLDRFVELAGGRLRGSAALLLAIAGNAMKAFPGLGTVGGGLVHAVAYAMIFDSLGRAVADTLARGDGFDRKAALERFDAGLGDRGRLLELAPEMLKRVLAARGERPLQG
ncbi:MAG: 50S ribosome-binding GTPase [Xanthomonadales bacterium]|nr:50S ribosome-binding GTPase [Xanthomonadales bacterium]